MVMNEFVECFSPDKLTPHPTGWQYEGVLVKLALIAFELF
jgi:hypothetical protein